MKGVVLHVLFNVLKAIVILVLKCYFSMINTLRQPGEDSKMLVCDACDKGYHTFCLQPAMDSLPSDPWKCRVKHFSNFVYSDLLLFVVFK